MTKLRKKHQILKVIYQKEIHCPEHWWAGSKGIPVEELDKNVGFKIEKEILDSLLVNSLIIISEQHLNKKQKTYCLTGLGKSFYLDKTLLNRLWYRSRDFWVAIFAVGISLVALFRS